LLSTNHQIKKIMPAFPFARGRQAYFFRIGITFPARGRIGEEICRSGRKKINNGEVSNYLDEEIQQNK
jgi:hypothetical protein